MKPSMKNFLKVSTISLLLICATIISAYSETSYKKPSNLNQAYEMMQNAYKSCMQAVQDFSIEKIDAAALDEKLKLYTFYKQQYEKLTKAEKEKVETPDASSGNQDSNSEQTPVQTTISAELQKKLDAILKYDSSIGQAPEITGGIGKFFRNLFKKSTISDLLSDGYVEFQKGDYQKAAEKFEAAKNKDPQNKTALYYLALSKANAGDAAEAETIINSMYNTLKDEKWAETFRSFTDPWVEANVAFKIGGFDSLDSYKKKIAAGNRKELHGDEYYEKYVNPNTFNYYSESARKEFESIAGIDCGGFVQRVYMDMCKKNGIKPPFSYKVPGRELEDYGTQLEEDGLIPPMSAKPGDFMVLKEHEGWGHAFYFAGRDADGRPLIVEASGEGKVLARPMPDRYYQWYQGTYKFKDMDKIREKMSLPN